MSTVTVESLAPAAPPLDLDGAQRTHDLDRAHVFHSWSAQGALDPMVVTGAQGSWVWDGDGRPFLDFSSQLVNTNIGHQHPAVVRGIQEQAAKLCTIAPQHANDARSEAARLIVERAPGETSATSSSPTAAPRRSRTPSGWPACTPAAARCSPATAATTATPRPRST